MKTKPIRVRAERSVLRCPFGACSRVRVLPVGQTVDDVVALGKAIISTAELWLASHADCGPRRFPTVRRGGRWATEAGR